MSKQNKEEMQKETRNTEKARNNTVKGLDKKLGGPDRPAE